MNRCAGICLVALVVAAVFGGEPSRATAAITLSLDPADWDVYTASWSANGPLEPGGVTPQLTAAGLEFGPRGYRQGTFVVSAPAFDLRDATLYYRWMPDGDGRYMSPSVGTGWWNGGVWTVANRAFTVNGWYGGMTRLYDDTWYYTRLAITPDAQFRCVTSTGDYDTQGGTVVDDSGWGSVRTYPADVWDHAASANIYAYLWDNRSTSAKVTLGEVRIEPNPEPASVVVWSLLGVAALTIGRRRGRRTC